MCQSLFFNNFADLRPATLLTKETLALVFSVNSVKFLRTPFSQNTSEQLLLHTDFLVVQKGEIWT